MAAGKNAVIVYKDWITTFDKMSDEEAGRLIKHFFKYVNDMNPQAPDRVTELLFEPIKQTLKRDLLSWEEKRENRANAGRLGGLAKANKYLANASIATTNVANLADSVSVSVSVIEKEEEKEEHISASDSSSQKQKPFNFQKALIDIGVSEQVAKDWIAVRKAKKATGTETAFNRIHEQIKKSGLTADECISIAVERSWQGFNAEWLHGQTKQLPPPNINKAYERWDAASQTRYFGTQVIPYDAPPRPSNLEKWDDKNKKWFFSMN